MTILSFSYKFMYLINKSLFKTRKDKIYKKKTLPPYSAPNVSYMQPSFHLYHFVSIVGNAYATLSTARIKNHHQLQTYYIKLTSTTHNKPAICNQIKNQLLVKTKFRGLRSQFDLPFHEQVNDDETQVNKSKNQALILTFSLIVVMLISLTQIIYEI